jgi:hypothetical protein
MLMMELLTALEDSAFSTWLRESTSIWAYPTILTLHTVGLAILVGTNAVFDLRVLGFADGVPLARIQPFFRTMWAGFWINAVTGAMLFATVATTKGTATVFMLKLGLVVLGVGALLFLRRSVYGGGTAPRITAGARRWAIVSLVVWTAAIVTGRLMAYL